ncbi:hypothetical protein BTR14_08925 [Rhizobium rhizosphaerae]|uniref:Uncharacterized protein n=1 Tax=Xaviernesmea rhizosphaerae TaxID=1672749 RepID=A0ABX3PEP0_9HYPH|nr:hypothetical protein BTR14_08925 [Xaviernesmea rhizosphaerae]
MRSGISLRGDCDGEALRRLARQTKDAAQARPLLAWRHMGRLVETIQPAECQNYLENAGYGSVKRGSALLR